MFQGGWTTLPHFLKYAKAIDETDKHHYNYNNLVPDIVIAVISAATKDDTGAFVQKHLAERAGTADRMFFLKDQSGSIIGHAWFFATRKDYLRLGIMIANDWKSDTCIGKYLRDVEKNKISKGSGFEDWDSYGGFFHFGLPQFDGRIASLKGHGGQRIIMDLDTGRVLTLHAIRKDYDTEKIFKLF